MDRNFYIILLLMMATAPATAQLYHFDAHSLPRWSSPENRNGVQGKGAMAGGGNKGQASFTLAAGQTLDLLDIRGQGIIHRIWITVTDRSPRMLRSMRLEMYWDQSDKPAVSAPLGDFFGVGLGRTARFHNALFADPEGRSFNCFIPMPFRTGARIRLVNESGQTMGNVFFDVDYELTDRWDPDNLYFHAWWHRDTATALASDFELLPTVQGRGRFLGVNIGVTANAAYGDLWWGEGEVKMYLDGDTQYPTLAGTGTEDYIGTGWGQNEFFNDYTGCLVADTGHRQWAFYRYHLADPIFFQTSCRATIQQMGGGPSRKVHALQAAHVPLTITHAYGGADGWTNFYRSDDVSATVYFYLDKPVEALPPLQAAAVRTAGLSAQ
ncbi:MAG TPA: glycoside hydrolase family 172 protein [Dinghuibacter sp.]|uniref:glycoside hydrolase family 172 protein n=1 Tax=Dinghuibacter sp. TaxID=2024697 RepID=UPI002CCA2AC3|nr:glycoside hydrolase family 172 protein [Dinghuibacter sp.]HTJ14697.1 glycoside hydrolase family 172 protein [Dinghuibacter sp.]